MNALTTTAAPMVAQNSSIALLMDTQRFDHLVRVGKMLALSPLFPQHLRGGSIEAGTANGVLVLNMAQRLNEDVLTVAQNIYFVGGRPGWNTTYMIAKANQHGVFKDVIDWEVKGKGDTLSVTAFAILKTTGRRVSVTLDMETAKKEGWTKNAKYQSIPEQMLRYRTAAFMIRLYCPEVMIGLPLSIEVEMEARDITPDGGPVVEANEDPPIEAEAAKPTQAKAAPEPVKQPERQGRADAQRSFQEGAAASADVADAQQGAGQAVDDTAARGGQADQGLFDQETGEVRHGHGSPSEPTEEELERFTAVAGMIVAEIQTGCEADDINQMYGPQIEVIQKRFPDLMEMINKAFLARDQR